MISILETRDLCIYESVQYIEDMLKYFKELTSDAGQEMFHRLTNILQENPGYTQIKAISQILSKGEADTNVVDLEPNEIRLFRYAPVTSCDVERSFSQFKSILRDNRISFTKENLTKYVVTQCNLNLL